MASVTDNTAEFCSQFVAKVSALKSVSENDIGNWISTELKPLCYKNVHNYLIAQSILTGLTRESEDGVYWGQMLKRITQDLSAGLGESEEALMVTEAVKFSGIPVIDVVEALISIQRDKKPTSGDITKLYQNYNSTSPPSCTFLRDATFIDALISDTFTPQRSASLLDEKLWLLAYAATVMEGKGEGSQAANTEEFKTVLASLQSLDKLTSKVTSMTQIQDSISEFLQATENPMTSMALLSWISDVLKSGSDFYEWSMLREEVPAAFNLVDEISINHPFTREPIAQFWYDLLERGYESQDPLMTMDIKQKLVDHLILLVRIGYVSSVLNYLSDHAEELDESIRTHFITHILAAVDAPYPPMFIVSLVKIIKSLPPPDKYSETYEIVLKFISMDHFLSRFES
ncbi:TH1 protein [Phlyctochytrium arcticum]|nr:TH1 protein [Phlyctochytrium arcticum]